MAGLRKNTELQENFIFSEAEKRAIVEDYLQSGATKESIWYKYTGRHGEHGVLLKWMRKYGYFSDKEKKSIFVPKKSVVAEVSKYQHQQTEFENMQLKRRISELEKQLSESELKSVAWQTMVEIAERELKINIKKKFNTKPSKK